MHPKTKSVILGAAAFILITAATGIAQNRPLPGTQGQHAICDQNRDGICDTCGQPAGSGLRNAQGQRAAAGRHYGPGNGTGNQGVGPNNGTGYGSQAGKRTGPRDGSQARIDRQGQPGGGNTGGGRP